jgi:RNase P subunit RPR2
MTRKEAIADIRTIARTFEHGTLLRTDFPAQEAVRLLCPVCQSTAWVYHNYAGRLAQPVDPHSSLFCECGE